MLEGTISEKVNWGVSLPNMDTFRTGLHIERIGGLARAAEELGFGSVWAGDHIAFAAPIIEPYIALAAVGSVTRSIGLATGVALLPLRHPVWVAKETSSLEAMYPGRVTLGIGIGGESDDEFAAIGVLRGRRGRRADWALSVISEILSGCHVESEFDGTRIACPPLAPLPQRKVPIAVGGRSHAAAARAARFQATWLAMWLTPERLQQTVEKVNEADDSSGAEKMKRGMLILFNIQDRPSLAAQDLQSFAQGQYGISGDRLAKWYMTGSVAQVADEIGRFLDVGVTQFVFLATGQDLILQYERLASAIQQLDFLAR